MTQPPLRPFERNLGYQSGQFAGSPHGRELHGYVPWSFNMPSRSEHYFHSNFADRFGGKPGNAIDGKIIYNTTPVNRWTSYGSPNAESDWLEIDFGKAITAGRVQLHVFDDGGGV